MTNYTPNLLSQYQDSLKDYRDLKNSMDTYKQEGRQERDKENALNAIKKGLDDTFVQELTGLSLEEINKLREENNL